MHVFPRVTLSGGDEVAAGGAEGDAASAAVHSIELLCASCELPTFKEMVQHKTPSWGQRKRLAKALQEMAERFAEAEAKMINMQVHRYSIVICHSYTNLAQPTLLALK
jgi:hypothetical protein